MKRNAIVLSLMLLTTHQLLPWEWPTWLLTSRVGSWFMDKNQKHFYKTMLTLKECQKVTAAQQASKIDRLREDKYRQKLKALHIPVLMFVNDEYKREKTIRDQNYTIHGYILKLDQALKPEETFNTGSNSASQPIDKSILTKNIFQHRSHIQFSERADDIAALPDPINKKYGPAITALELELSKMETAKFESKTATPTGTTIFIPNEHQKREELAKLEAQKTEEEKREFEKVHEIYARKVNEIEKLYSTLSPMQKKQKLRKQLEDEALFYKNATAGFDVSIHKYNDIVYKNDKLYTELLKKNNITL